MQKPLHESRINGHLPVLGHFDQRSLGLFAGLARPRERGKGKTMSRMSAGAADDDCRFN
jgi:hypothetical protein